jgi:hypothetical protein
VILCIGIVETVESILSARFCDVISRENNATDFFWMTDALMSRLTANAVFPIDGRAARIINSPLLNHQVISSSLT